VWQMMLSLVAKWLTALLEHPEQLPEQVLNC
jgi:hypothetical protein